MSNLTRFAFWVNGVALAFYVFIFNVVIFLKLRKKTTN